MFEQFERYFNIRSKEEIQKDENQIDYFVRSFGGQHLLNGMFTVFKQNDLEKWEKNVKRFFYNLKENFKLFGYDWQGNCYGIILNNATTLNENVVMFEIGTNKILSFSCDFNTFINKTFIDQLNSILVPQFFESAVKLYDDKIGYGKCIGYKRPLFMGGQDIPSNLEYSDMDVYWTVLAQVIESVRR